MPYGSPWSEQFLRQLSDNEVRSEFVADQMRARIAQLIRTLREQSNRNWTQAELGDRAGKPQNVISRFEDPNYGKMSLQSLFDLAAAFDLPVWIDMPEWSDWFTLISDIPNRETIRSGFDLEKLADQTRANPYGSAPAAGAAASAAAEAMRNMIVSPPQMLQILGSAANANTLSQSQLPPQNIEAALGNALLTGSVAA